MTTKTTIFLKDEEKDINLLLARIKKSPPIFRDRVIEKLQEFSSLFGQVKSSPSEKHVDFCRLCLFFGQVYEFYNTDLRPTLESLIQLFEQNSSLMLPILRYKIIQTLIMIKKKGFIDFFKSFDFFINVFSFPDKQLRCLVFEHFSSYMKSMASRKQLLKNETRLLAIFQKTLLNGTAEIQRRVIKLLTKLYLTNVWTTVKSANLIANEIHSKDHKVAIMVAHFLIASTESTPKEPEDEDDEENNFAEIKKQYSLKNKCSKKKIEKLERQMKNIQKKEDRMAKLVATSRVFPIDLLYNPSQFVDKIYSKLMKDKNMKYTLKHELMCLVGRMIGRYKLIYPNFYNYVIRFVKPELKSPERLFAFVAESIHTNSPLGEVEMICKQFLDTFVCEGNSEEKIIVGINFLRLAMIRNELALNSEQINQIAYFRYTKNKHISGAAKGFINVVRDLCPDLLNKEYHVYNFKGELDTTVKRKLDVNFRIDGAELLKQDVDGMEVENQRVFTDEDFRKIRRLKARKVMDKMEQEEEEEDNAKRAIHMPKISVIDENDRKKLRGLTACGLTDQELEEMMNDPNYEQIVEELEQNEEDDEEDDEDDEEYDDECEDEDDEEFEDDEECDENDEEGVEGEDDNQEFEIEENSDDDSAEPKNAEVNKSNSEDDEDDYESDEDSEGDLFDHEEQMEKRGFCTENMLNTKKSLKEQRNRTQLVKFEQALQRKYLFKKAQKKGSKTNTDKKKFKPAMMIVEKMRNAKKLVKQSKKKISKDKNFKGRPTKYDRKDKKR